MSPDRNPLAAALHDLALQSPEQDRLQAVLAALHANHVKPVPQSHLTQSHLIQGNAPRTRTLWLSGLAASVAILTSVWLLHNPHLPIAHQTGANPTTVSPTQGAPASARAEISALIADSQWLETQLRELGKRRASFRQLNALSQAELSLSALDSSLANASASKQQDALNQQRALWRERVAVLSAVNQGDYRPALYAID
jgi:hypothetical protein